MLLSEEPRGAHAGMPREVELDSGGEDAHLAAGGVVDEHGLAEPEIARHLLGAGPPNLLSIQENRQRIAAAAVLGQLPGAGEAWARPKTTGVAPDRVPPMAGDIELRAGEESVYQGIRPGGPRLLLSAGPAGGPGAAPAALGSLSMTRLRSPSGWCGRGGGAGDTCAGVHEVRDHQPAAADQPGHRQPKVQETRLDRVQNVNFDQSVFDRMLSVGTVDFDTAGTDDSEFRFEWVNDPEGVVRAVNDAIHEQPGAGL